MILTDPMSSMTVIVCCANWCGVCRDFKAPLQELARRHSEHRFVWIDVEDTQEWDDEIDIENFPTVLVVGNDSSQYFQGPIEPHIKALGKLLDALQENSKPIALADDLQRLVKKINLMFLNQSTNFMDLA